METNQEEQFIGRHEEFCLVKKLLGEEVPDLEIQIAKNKDTSEREGILNRLEELEGFVRSKDFSQSNVLELHDKAMGLVSDAGKLCISENDTELGNRLYKILDDTIEYAKAKYREKGELTDELSEKLEGISKNFRLADFLGFLQLHDLLNTADHQMGFYIWNSLVRNNSFIVTLIHFNKATDKNDTHGEYSERLEKFAENLQQTGRISGEDLQKVREEISRGEQ